jgi:signal transduction histidine kinase
MLKKWQYFLLGTLQRQLIVGISLIVSLMMALFVFNTVLGQSQLALERNKQQTLALAQNAALTAAVGLSTHDYSALQEIATHFKAFPDVVYIMVLDRSGQIIAHSDSVHRGQYLNDLAQDNQIHIIQENLSRIEILYPIVLAGNHLGWIQIASSRLQLQAERESIKMQAIVFTLIGILFSLLFAGFVSRYFVHRLMAIQRIADAVQIGKSDLRVHLLGQDEAARLAEAFNQMLDALAERESAIRLLNTTLEARVQEELKKSREKDLILIQQSRLASMGEMIHNIAHQWRQPLNSLAIMIANIADDFKYGELDGERLNSIVRKSQTILNQMSNTIDDFRDFFRPDKEAKTFDLTKTIDDALTIIDASLANNQIQLTKNYSSPLDCYGYPSQLSQVILNVLSNAKDAIKQRQIEHAMITIAAYQQGQSVFIDISDNAGGVDAVIMDKIFDPYFTTKETGSGIGLYMARMIVERNHHGSISMCNEANGAKFSIRIPQSSEL